MAKSFLTDINLNRNVLLNAKIQAWGSTPTGTGSPDGSGNALAGQISAYLGDLYIFTGASGTPANTWSRVGNTLSDSTSTTSSTTGASSTAVKAAYDLAAAALPKSGGTMTGAIAMGSNNITGTGSISATTFTGALTGNASTATTASATTGTLTFGTGLTAGGASFNGSAAITITPVSASTTAAGIVQLSDSTSTTGSTKAATETAVKAAYDRGSTGVTNAATAQSTADAALPKAGGTMSGAIAMGNNKITGLGTPTGDADAATKLYVDSTAQGIDWKASVRAATTANGTLASAYANGSVVDGVTLATGNRILIKDQTTGSENGIYTVNATGAPTRAIDADSASEIVASFAVFVEEGTDNADCGFVLTNNGTVTVGTTALTFTQFTGLGQVTAGNGLTKTGNTLNAVGTSDRITVGTDSIDIASTYAGQSTITTVSSTTGITTGAWKATVIDPAYGGTGVANTGKTITLGGNLTTLGAFATTITSTATTNVTLPAGTSTLVNTAVATLSSLTSVGTIGTGVWQGTAVGVLYGGTGATTAAAARTNLGATTKVTLVGTGTGSSIALTHGLGTNLVTAQVYDTSTSTATLVEVDITVTSTVATATFASATTTLSNYTLVVIG